LWKEVALLAHESDDRPGELEAWQRALAADEQLAPEAAPRLLALGRALLDTEPALAEVALQETTRHAGPADAAEAWRTLARLERRRGGLDAASDALLHAAEAAPDALRGDVLLERAELAEERGDAASATDSYRRVLQLAPSSARGRAPALLGGPPAGSRWPSW
jgi:tetratricopeptide (TPR) repeat protein